VSDTPPEQPPPEEPPPPPPPPTAAGAEAAAEAAAQSRDTIEEAARILFASALLWVALHDDEQPNKDTAVRRAARSVASKLLYQAEWLIGHPIDYFSTSEKQGRKTKERLRSRLLHQAEELVGHPIEFFEAGDVPSILEGPERQAWIDKLAERLTRTATTQAWDHLATVTRRMKDEDPHVTPPTIRAAFRTDHAWSNAAARSTATRETSETLHSLREDVEKATGEPHSLMWISRGDPKVRELHRTLHGRVRHAGDPFYTWPDGQTLNFPGDPSAPIDAWINCRCTLLMVPTRDAARAEEIFHVPDADFDVPVAASAAMSRARADLRSELLSSFARH
jgi:hypothetical protein